MKKGDKKFRKEFGKRIRGLRKNQKISQSQLAYESEITRELLTKIEGGHINTTLKTLLAIANALNLKVKDLFDFEY